LLVVGNGLKNNNNITTANAFVVKKNGNAEVTGALSAQKLVCLGNSGPVLPDSGTEGEIFFLELQ
jgi:hypothetical protein